jgi:hypothetical protein
MTETPTITSSVFAKLIPITLRKFFNFLGFAGVMFILYGVVSEGTGSVWAPLEKWVNPLSALLTVVGAILTAASIYFYSPQTRPPELFSKYVSAPFTIAAGIGAVAWLLIRKSLPPVIVNGFALMAIAGGLFRIQRNPGENW